MLALCAMSCRTRERTVYRLINEGDSIVTERLVPVSVAPDSALLSAIFECDSNNQVILRAYNELKSAGTQSDLSFKDGKLDYGTITAHDTVYIPAPTIYKPVPVPAPTEYINHLTWWQKTSMYLGWIFLLYILVKNRLPIWGVILKLLKLS